MMKLSLSGSDWLKVLYSLGISSVLALSAVNTNAVTYYETTGKHGEIKYSQFPPTHGNYKTIELRSDGRRVDTGQVPNTANPNNQGDANTDQEKLAMQKRIDDLEKQENQRRCQTLRNNLANLNSGGRIYEQGDNGSRQFLDDQAIEQKRDKIQQALNQYCSGQSA